MRLNIRACSSMQKSPWASCGVRRQRAAPPAGGATIQLVLLLSVMIAGTASCRYLSRESDFQVPILLITSNGMPAL